MSLQTSVVPPAAAASPAVADPRIGELAVRSEAFPFCSERCRLLDLGAWADERYQVQRPLSYEDLDDLDPGHLGGQR